MALCAGTSDHHHGATDRGLFVAMTTQTAWSHRKVLGYVPPGEKPRVVAIEEKQVEAWPGRVYWIGGKY
jgi:hypothetical protein